MVRSAQPLAESLFVLDEKNIVKGVAQRLTRVKYQDEAARLRMFGDMVQRRAEELARIDNMVAPDTAEHRIQMDYNRRILAGEQVDPLAVTDAATLRRIGKSRAAALPDAPPAEEFAGMGLPESYDEPTFL